MGELLNLVGLSTGIVLYGMLLAMVVRVPRKLTPRGPFDRLPLTTAILGMVWNLCALPIYELPIVGIRQPVPLLSVVGFSALGFLPAVVVHSVLRTGTVELLGHHASLPLALAILYQDYPFALADLFLKRALTLLALVAAAFLTIALLGLPFRNGASLVIVGPREVSLVVTLWVVTALLY